MIRLRRKKVKSAKGGQVSNERYQPGHIWLTERSDYIHSSFLSRITPNGFLTQPGMTLQLVEN